MSDISSERDDSTSSGLLRTVLSWSIFPVVLVGVLSGAFYALDAGAAPGMVAFVGGVLSVVIVAGLERIHRYRRDWNHSKGDLLTDALYFPTYMGLNALLEPAVRSGAVVVGGLLSESLGLGLWPDSWPLLAQFVLACVVVEAFDYWPHRLLHEVPWLWRFHAVHHNPERVYWLNATRAHPVEIVFRGFVNVIPLAIAGASEELLALVALTNSVLGLFQHANVDFRMGVLTWIFSVGEMHRWHHSVNIEEANHNYGSNFLVWDIVFGTWYRDPGSRGPEVVGIKNDFLPKSWWGQLPAPFRKATSTDNNAAGDHAPPDKAKQNDSDNGRAGS